MCLPFWAKPYKKSQLCCVRNSRRPPLREQYLNERATGGAVEPSPWPGRGTGGGSKSFLMKEGFRMVGEFLTKERYRMVGEISVRFPHSFLQNKNFILQVIFFLLFLS